MSWKDVTVMSERVKFVDHREPWGSESPDVLEALRFPLEHGDSHALPQFPIVVQSSTWRCFCRRLSSEQTQPDTASNAFPIQPLPLWLRPSEAKPRWLASGTRVSIVHWPICTRCVCLRHAV